MEATIKDVRYGRLSLKYIIFDNAGDTVANHRHLDTGHLSFLMKGKVVCRVVGMQDYVLTAPAIAYWPIGTEHEWECLEGPATLVNVFAS
jgi:quercetin dioxygenase-like cupin family protein